jgi:hypothetical protein
VRAGHLPLAFEGGRRFRGSEGVISGSGSGLPCGARYSPVNTRRCCACRSKRPMWTSSAGGRCLRSDAGVVSRRRITQRLSVGNGCI